MILTNCLFPSAPLLSTDSTKAHELIDKGYEFSCFVAAHGYLEAYTPGN